MNKLTLKESLFSGVVFMAVGLLLHYVYSKYKTHDMNNMQMYALHLFVVGMLTHLLLEYLQVNKWYCKNGNACLLTEKSN